MTVAPNLGEILLVDDDCVDAMVVKRVLKDLGITDELVWAVDGEEALAYLRNPEDGTPYVILLDLNMPRMNGIEFLEVLRANKALKDIRVAVVTTSSEAKDMARSSELGAASYIVKCSDYEEFREKIAAIKSYLVVVLPAATPESARR
jgi:CheY-like chemotaxis protein